MIPVFDTQKHLKILEKQHHCLAQFPRNTITFENLLDFNYDLNNIVDFLMPM